MAKITNNQQRTLLKTEPNKAKVKIGKMNVSIFYKKDYENISDWTLGENKPKQSQS